VLAVIACGVIGTLLLVAHTDSKKDSQFARLQAAANAACGTDRTLGVTWHPSGFARRESFATHCRKPNGEVYVVVTQK